MVFFMTHKERIDDLFLSESLENEITLSYCNMNGLYTRAGIFRRSGNSILEIFCINLQDNYVYDIGFNVDWMYCINDVFDRKPAFDRIQWLANVIADSLRDNVARAQRDVKEELKGSFNKINKILKLF